MAHDHSASRTIVVLAAIVIVLFGIQSAAGVIVPLLIALLITILFTPLVEWLAQRINYALAMMSIIVFVMVLMGAMAGIVGTSVRDFTTNLPQYDRQLEAQLENIAILLERWHIEVSTERILGVVDPKAMMHYAAIALSSTMSVATNGFVILLSMIFMMLETRQFEAKFRQISSDEAALAHYRDIVEKIKTYMILKVLISAATGGLITLMLVIVGVDYPFLWGTVAFLLNFIPNIGSLVAAVPAVLLALIQLDWLHALIVASGYIVVNVLIGSIIEPKVTGQGVGLSTLVVFLSLIFWGALLGPVGMLLAVPLTIMIKITLASQPDTRWIATILDINKPIHSEK